MLNNQSHPNYSTQKLTTKQLLKIEIQEAVSAVIRKKFDNAFSSSTTHACIEVANEIGLKDLAKEMINDANLEQEAYA